MQSVWKVALCAILEILGQQSTIYKSKLAFSEQKSSLKASFDLFCFVLNDVTQHYHNKNLEDAKHLKEKKILNKGILSNYLRPSRTICFLFVKAQIVLAE